VWPVNTYKLRITKLSHILAKHPFTAIVTNVTIVNVALEDTLSITTVDLSPTNIPKPVSE
jgi:hypothetical protein